MGRILIGRIRGPQGPIGPTGAQGPRGERGPQGPLPPLTNNGLATVAGVSALDAAYGKTLTEKDADLQKQIDDTNSNLNSKASTSSVTNLENRLSSIFKRSDFCFVYSADDDFKNILGENGATQLFYIATKSNAIVFGRENLIDGKYYGAQLKLDHNLGLSFRNWGNKSKGDFGPWVTK